MDSTIKEHRNVPLPSGTQTYVEKNYHAQKSVKKNDKILHISCNSDPCGNTPRTIEPVRTCSKDARPRARPCQCQNTASGRSRVIVGVCMCRQYMLWKLMCLENRRKAYEQLRKNEQKIVALNSYDWSTWTILKQFTYCLPILFLHFWAGVSQSRPQSPGSFCNKSRCFWLVYLRFPFDMTLEYTGANPYGSIAFFCLHFRQEME